MEIRSWISDVEHWRFQEHSRSWDNLMLLEILRCPKLICWQPPQEGWIKVNSDGAFNSRTGLATAWGVIRDWCGN